MSFQVKEKCRLEQIASKQRAPSIELTKGTEISMEVTSFRDLTRHSKCDWELLAQPCKAC